MKISIKFPVLNLIHVKSPWPITIGNKTYFIELKDDKAVFVGIQYSGIPVSAAPTITNTPQGETKAQITFNSGNYTLSAERDLRAWQSLLAPYLVVDLDFDSPSEEFKPENEGERTQINLHNFSRTKQPITQGGVDFGLFGRAFLSIEHGVPLIEVMSLYRDAIKSLFAERSIDAYNQFYLFFETQYCGGQTGTNRAVDLLLESHEFMSALGKVAEEAKAPIKRKAPRFASLKLWPNEKRQLVREIVELRGKLRHHSLNSPHRWDPNKQEHYDAEARFLSLVAQEVAFPKSAILWEQSCLENFTRLAKEMRMNIEIHVRITIKENQHVRDVAINMTFPQPHADAELAKAVLTKTLETLEEKDPKAELIGVRAYVKSKNIELFRYDLGPTIGRGGD